LSLMNPRITSRYFTRSSPAEVKAIVGTLILEDGDTANVKDEHLEDVPSAQTKPGVKRRRISAPGQVTSLHKNSRAPATEPTEKQEVLPPVPDIIAKELDILFCGINPGETSSRRGHHFSHPSNRFWPSLYAGGLTPTRMVAAQDTEVLTLDPSLGLTNLCGRPSKEEKDLKQDEHKSGAEILLQKINEWRPRIVAFAGFGIWDKFIGAVESAEPVKNRRRPEPNPKQVLPYKVVHSVSSGARSELSPKAPFIEVKQEDELVPMTVLDSSSPVTETLFFKIPNPSGRVTAYKPKDYADFVAGLKQELLRAKAGLLDTSDFTVINRI